MTFMICLSNGNVKTSAGFLFIDDVKTLDTRTISPSQEHIPYTEATSAVVQPVMARNVIVIFGVLAIFIMAPHFTDFKIMFRSFKCELNF